VAAQPTRNPVPPSRSPITQIIGATILLLVAGVVFIPAFLYWNGSIRRSATVLPRCGAAPHFESTDQLGRSVGTKGLSDTIWVAGFVDDARPDDAELLCSKFAELDQNLQGAKKVALVSFFVGADKNKVEDYVRRFEASDRWRFISISRSSTLVQEWNAAGAGCRHDLQAQNVFLLIDRQDEIRGIYNASASEVVQNILIDAGNLLRAEHLAP
jgi:hypothetical protein